VCLLLISVFLQLGLGVSIFGKSLFLLSSILFAKVLVALQSTKITQDNLIGEEGTAHLYIISYIIYHISYHIISYHILYHIISYLFSSNCVNAQTAPCIICTFTNQIIVFKEQVEHDITNNTSGVNQTAEPLKLTHQASGVPANTG